MYDADHRLKIRGRTISKFVKEIHEFHRIFKIRSLTGQQLVSVDEDKYSFELIFLMALC